MISKHMPVGYIVHNHKRIYFNHQAKLDECDLRNLSKAISESQHELGIITKVMDVRYSTTHMNSFTDWVGPLAKIKNVKTQQNFDFILGPNIYYIMQDFNFQIYEQFKGLKIQYYYQIRNNKKLILGISKTG